MDNKNKQEENVETFSENVDIKKEKSAKVKRTIKFIIQLIIPFFFIPLTMLFGLIISTILVPSANRSIIGIGTALLFLFFWPLYSLIYGIFTARSEKNSRFAKYNAIVSTLQFFILSYFDLDAIWLYVGIFFTILFWTSVPIWIYNFNHKPDN